MTLYVEGLMTLWVLQCTSYFHTPLQYVKLEESLVQKIASKKRWQRVLIWQYFYHETPYYKVISLSAVPWYPVSVCICESSTSSHLTLSDESLWCENEASQMIHTFIFIVFFLLFQHVSSAPQDAEHSYNKYWVKNCQVRENNEYPIWYHIIVWEGMPVVRVRCYLLTYGCIRGLWCRLTTVES